MDSVLENNYIFEIDCLQTIKGLGGREVLNPMKSCNTIFCQLLHFNAKNFCLVSLVMLILTATITGWRDSCKSFGQIS